MKPEDTTAPSRRDSPRQFPLRPYRSLEDDKDFEVCVLIESEELARSIDREVRAEDIRWSRRIAPEDVHGGSWSALRVRSRGPRTLMMVAAREL